MKCEVCHSKEDIAGVASSNKGAISFCYCQLCLAMEADPKWTCDFVVENCGGLENGHKGCLLTYYDQLDDTYKDLRLGLIPITFDEGFSFLTKTDAMKEIKRIQGEEK